MTVENLYVADNIISKALQFVKWFRKQIDDLIIAINFAPLCDYSTFGALILPILSSECERMGSRDRER